MIESNSFRVILKMSGELWPRNFGKLKVKSYSPRSTLSEDYISAPERFCAPKFLHALENDQILLARISSEPKSPNSFYARKQLLLSARLSHRNSVRLSVCPSHGWISQKRCKLGSPNLHRSCLKDSSFRNRKAFP